MDKVRNFFKKVNIASIFAALAVIAVGLFLICAPNTALLTICYVLGACVVLFGLISIANYFVYGFEPFGFVTGICEVALGTAFLCFAPQIADSKIFAVLAGVYLMIASLFKVQNSMDVRRMGVRGWWLYMIYGLVIFALSIVLMANPFDGQRVLLIFMGVELLIDGIFGLVSIITFKGKLRRIKNQFVDDVIDVENLDK